MNGKNLQDVLQNAVDRHREGNIYEAERIYRQVLAVSPDNALALQHLGIIAVQCGKPEEGAAMIARSIDIEPSAAALNNLGEALRAMGRLQQAADCYRRSLTLDPRQVDAMANLGILLLGFKQFAEAEIVLRRAISIAPTHLTAMAAMADLLVATERSNEGLAAWEQIVRMYPDNPLFVRSLGAAWLMSGDPYRAINAFRRSIEIDPKYLDGHRGLMMAYEKLNNGPETIQAAREALAIAPDSWQSHQELAIALQKSQQFEESAEEFGKAAKLNPQHPLLFGGRGSALTSLGRFAEAAEMFVEGTRLSPGDWRMHGALSTCRFALADYNGAVEAARNAVAANPKDAQNHACLSFALLAAGNFEDGFKEYEWRWRDTTFEGKPRDFDRPMWDGADPAGRTILIHSEQGFGDVFQFLRYAYMLRARGATVLVETNYKAAGLARRMAGDLRVYMKGTMLPDFDMHVPMMSLPVIFGTTVNTIPAVVPYLSADPVLAARWRARLEPAEGLLVGLAWAGNPKPDPKRSATLADLAPLGGVGGVTLIAMQATGNEAADPPEGMKVKNVGPELIDFAETTASVLANLDLMITIDTGVAHLAGAMGVPTWIMLPHSADWRWTLQENTTLWYPNVRLFRQPKRDDWASVVETIATELRKLSERHAAPA